MALITVNTDPSRRELRQFGFIWLAFLSFFGAVVRFKMGAPAAANGLWVAAVLVPLVGWFFPAFMRVVFVGMSFAAFPIGWVVSHIVLAIVFYLILTPVGLMMRLFRYDPMHRRFDRQAESYWIQREPHPDPKQYFRQW